MTTETVYRSDTRPDFDAVRGAARHRSRASTYAGDLAAEVAAGALDRPEALDLLDDMLAIREMEEMIVRLRSGGYDALPGYDYRGPDARLDRPGGVGGRRLRRCCAIDGQRHELAPRPRRRDREGLRGDPADEPTSSSRARVARLAGGTREELLDAALEEHVYRVIAELFGKDEGYCRGRGGGMHIGDFSTGNLGANAIVGG